MASDIEQREAPAPRARIIVRCLATPESEDAASRWGQKLRRATKLGYAALLCASHGDMRTNKRYSFYGEGIRESGPSVSYAQAGRTPAVGPVCGGETLRDMRRQLSA